MTFDVLHHRQVACHDRFLVSTVSFNPRVVDLSTSLIKSANGGEMVTLGGDGSGGRWAGRGGGGRRMTRFCEDSISLLSRDIRGEDKNRNGYIS